MRPLHGQLHGLCRAIWMQSISAPSSTMLADYFPSHPRSNGTQRLMKVDLGWLAEHYLEIGRFELSLVLSVGFRAIQG